MSNKSIVETTDRKINIVTPTRFVGKGKIKIGNRVVFGVAQSPRTRSESWIEARHPNSTISFGDHTAINNDACITSDGANIIIGMRCLIGPEFIAIDTNGHMSPVSLRLERDNNPLDIIIGDDVFIGSRVTILKGVLIGSGSIIAAGSVILPKFEAPDRSVIAGNPAIVIGQVPPN